MYDSRRFEGADQYDLEHDEEVVPSWRIRILIVLFHLLMSPTGCRPGSLLWTRFGDLKLSLVRDSGGGPHLIAIRFTPEHTKGYLGTKER